MRGVQLRHCIRRGVGSELSTGVWSSIRELVASGSFFATESLEAWENRYTEEDYVQAVLKWVENFLLRVGIILVALLDCGSGYNAGEFWNGVMIDDAGMGDADPDPDVFLRRG